MKRFVAAAALVVTLFRQTAVAAPAPAADYLAMVRVADAVDRAVDAKDWDTARGYFTQDVRVDFSSIGGGAPGVMPADDLVGAWRENLFPEKASFHLRGNHGVEMLGEDVAEMVSHGYAWNKLPGLADGELWEVWGVYEYTFLRRDGGWKISAFTFRATHSRGNAAVPSAGPIEKD